MCNPVLLERVFDLRRDGIVILKVLREGPAQCAHALLLLLYGYHQVKKEYVLATELYRPAEQSGSSIRGLAKEYATNHRYVVQGGRGKGSNYSLNSEGLATAIDEHQFLQRGGKRNRDMKCGSAIVSGLEVYFALQTPDRFVHHG